MTVGELIEKLSRYRQNQEVYIRQGFEQTSAHYTLAVREYAGEPVIVGTHRTNDPEYDSLRGDPLLSEVDI